MYVGDIKMVWKFISKIVRKLIRKIFYGFCAKEYVLFDSWVIREGIWIDGGTQKLWGRGEGTLRSSDKHLMREEPGVLKFPSGGEFLQYLNPMGLYWTDLTESQSRRLVYGDIVLKWGDTIVKVETLKDHFCDTNSMSSLYYY